MARPKTEYVNELKTRLDDETYVALKAHQRANRISSESRAAADLLKQVLLGTIGSVPALIDEVRDELGQFGPKTMA